MIVTSTVPYESQDRVSTGASRTESRYCQICGQAVPAGMSICYGCDVELGVGDWPSRPRRNSDRPLRFRGFGRTRSRFGNS